MDELEQARTEAREAQERWVWAQASGKRNSARYKRAYREAREAQAKFLALRLSIRG